MRFNDKIQIKKVESAFYRMGSANEFCSYVHGRGFCGIIVALDGRASFKFRDGTKQVIETGDVALFSDNIAYLYENDGGRTFKYYVINFTISSKCLIEDVIIRPDTLDGIISKCEQVVGYFHSGTPSAYLRCLASLYELLAEINECKIIDSVGVKPYNSVLPAIKFIDENFYTDVVVDDLAKMCVMSNTNFRRIFLGVTGEPPIQYLINVRLRRAKEMLRNTDMTVAEIGRLCGFKDVEHFCRTYKKKKGISPGSERRTEKSREEKRTEMKEILITDLGVQGNALSTASDGAITVSASEGSGVTTRKESSLCEKISVKVKGIVKSGSFNYYLYIYNEQGVESLVTSRHIVCAEDGSFDFSASFDPISLSVYSGASAFRAGFLAAEENSSVTITEFRMYEDKETAYEYGQDYDYSAVVTLDNGERAVRILGADGEVSYGSLIPSKVLFIGNSILLGMINRYGMCASAPDKDYAYLVSEKIKSLNPTCTFSKLHGACLEHSESRQMYEDALYREPNKYTGKPVADSFEPDLDLIFIQLTDNLTTPEKQQTFLECSDSFLKFVKERCPKARIVWIFGWYGYARSKEHLIYLSKKWQIELIPLVHLRENKINEAYEGQTFLWPNGERVVIKDTWVTHPGDIGMMEISKCIFKKLMLD